MAAPAEPAGKHQYQNERGRRQSTGHGPCVGGASTSERPSVGALRLDPRAELDRRAVSGSSPM
jgi:hypothetical protein